MRRLGVSIAIVAVVSVVSVVLAQGGFKRISEALTGYEETAAPEAREEQSRPPVTGRLRPALATTNHKSSGSLVTRISKAQCSRLIFTLDNGR
jgi:hypothetical protein